MDLSVVIPTHDKAPLLDRSLKALAGQQLAPGIRWQIVVVQDDCGDDTPEVLRRWQTDLPAGSLSIVVPPGNVGRASARNLGARAAAGRWIVFLDDDIEAPPDLLSAHLALWRQWPSDGIIGRVRTAPELVDGPHFHYIDSRGAAKVRQDILPARYFVTQNAGVPREAFLRVGGFDEGFTSYGFEDMDLAFRLEEREGMVFRALRQPIPVHLHHHTLVEYLAKKRLCGQGSLQRLAQLHPGKMREMRLHWIIDPPGGVADLQTSCFRVCARESGGRFLKTCLARWPVRERFRPVMAHLFFRLLDLAILMEFYAGTRIGEEAVE